MNFTGIQPWCTRVKPPTARMTFLDRMRLFIVNPIFIRCSSHPQSIWWLQFSAMSTWDILSVSGISFCWEQNYIRVYFHDLVCLFRCIRAGCLLEFDVGYEHVHGGFIGLLAFYDSSSRIFNLAHPRKVVRLLTIAAKFYPMLVFYMARACSWDAKLVAAATYASMTTRSSTAIAVVRVGSAAHIPSIDFWSIVFLLAICWHSGSGYVWGDGRWILVS